MPQRAYLLGEMIMGFLAVALLLLLGANVYAASTKGSPWRQRVLGAGMFAMILLGFLPDAGAAEPVEGKMAAPAGKENDPELERALQKILIQRPGWKKTEELRREVLRILERKKAYCDYDWTGKLRMRDGLEEAVRRVAAWRAEGILTPDETAFLAMDLRFLSGVLLRRQVAESASSSGLASSRHPRRDSGSFEYLRECRSVLEGLCSEARGHTPVLGEIIRILEFHLRNLSEFRIGMRSPAVDQAEARTVRKEVENLVRQLRERRKDALAVHPLWTRFLAFWNDARKFGAGRGLSHPFRQRDKDAILNALGDGPRLLDALVKVKKLSLAEAGLLKKEFDLDVGKIRELTVRKFGVSGTPLDRAGAENVKAGREAGKRHYIREVVPFPNPSCYSPGLPASYPAESAKAIRERLPLLERLAFQDKLRPEVLERVLGTVENHLLRLASSRSAPGPAPDGKEEIDLLIERAKGLLIRIKVR